MLISKYTGIIALVLLFVQCSSNRGLVFQNEDKSFFVTQIAPNAWVHTSYINIPDYGRFPCNGLIFRSGDQVIVYDTPIGDKTSTELINWVRTDLGSTIRAVVATHFHMDCLSGLGAFHKAGIASYANQATIVLAQTKDNPKPQNSFKELLEIRIGTEKAMAVFVGEGHTSDNVVGLIPGAQILFGGCLIKEVGAGKGNLEDANIEEWAETVSAIKRKYPDLKLVVPGHGKHGGSELLDYTIELFEQ